MKLALCVILAASASSIFALAATYLPVGPQQNVPVSAVTNGGWTLVYSGTYNLSAPISTVFNGVQPDQWVMYAARPIGSTTFTLLAAAPASDVMAQTAHNATTTSNGSEWYFNGGSIGFAPLGSTILQSSADITGIFSGSIDGSELRMSWHTQFNGSFSQYGSLPEDLVGGWRVGTIGSLNTSTDWERFVYVADVSGVSDPGVIPEPSGILAIGTLLSAGLLMRARRRSA
jgi:hypothetical protein